MLPIYHHFDQPPLRYFHFKMSSVTHIVIYDGSQQFRNAFKKLLLDNTSSNISKPQFTINKFRISIVPPAYTDLQESFNHVINSFNIDAIVSPGNSFGFLEGGFDLAISNYYAGVVNAQFSDKSLITAKDVSNAFRKTIINNENGFGSPGTARYFKSSFLNTINQLGAQSEPISTNPDCKIS